jgi:hypothetical protein
MKNFAKRIAAPHKEQFLFLWLVSNRQPLFFCVELKVSHKEQSKLTIGVSACLLS